MDVKPSDNFFDIGGNSMLAIQISERVVKETGVRIKLMQLAVPSLREIAADLPDVAVPGARSSSGLLLAGVTRLLGVASVRVCPSALAHSVVPGRGRRCPMASGDSSP